jgi:hypothetical protein
LELPLCDAPSRADGAQQKSFLRPVIANVINNMERVLTDRVRTLRAKVCFSSLQTISCQGALGPRWNQPKMFDRFTSTLSAHESHFRTVKAETWCDMRGFGESEVILRLVEIETKGRR